MSQPEQIVILGGGIHGAALAYYLTKRAMTDKKNISVTVVEQTSVGCAASGKAGGFLAREWGSGNTMSLHQKSFDRHIQLAEQLGVESFRLIPTFSVAVRFSSTVGVVPGYPFWGRHVSL